MIFNLDLSFFPNFIVSFVNFDKIKRNFLMMNSFLLTQVFSSNTLKKPLYASYILPNEIKVTFHADQIVFPFCSFSFNFHNQTEEAKNSISISIQSSGKVGHFIRNSHLESKLREK
jgi:hypothetical protein